MKIGIMGGTFNPIHLGHLIIAQILSEKNRIDKVLFIPCALPPHKTDKELIDKKHRLAMVELAIKSNPRFEASDIETKKEVKSYSIDTLKELKKIYKDGEFYFFIGEDGLADMHTWKNIKELVTLCQFVIAKRFYQPRINYLEAQKKFFDEKTIANFKENIIETNLIDISSSEIRKKISKNKSIKYLVLEAVEQYIRENKLYT